MEACPQEPLDTATKLHHRHVHQTMHHVRCGGVGALRLQRSHQNACATRTADTTSHQGSAGHPLDISGVYATDLLHMDAGIRSLRSDNEAAHLRLFHKVFNSGDTSIQHRVFKSLPDNHPWLQRGVQRTVALTTETTISSQPCTYAMSMEITNQKRLKRSMIP
jgi:hypothetical protein